VAKKDQKRLQAIPTTKMPRRFAGDHLYEWAQLMSAQQQLNAQIGNFIEQHREEYKIGPNELPDVKGYILPAQRRPIPVTTEQPAEQTTDSATEARP
jgi:hypothetical protein